MKKALLVLIPLCLIVLGGILVLNSIQSQQNTGGAEVQDPNKDFLLEGKSEYFHNMKGDKIIYEFQNRDPKDTRASKSVYDPSNWLLTFYPQSEGKAAFTITEGQVETLTGYMKPDGLFRVSSYKGVQGEPREFWQTLFNIIFFLPRNKEELAAPQFREFTFPSSKDHKIAGKAKFASIGSKDLGGTKTSAIEVCIELDVLSQPKGDKLTEFMAEGVLYYSEDLKLLIAGEWEWATGFVDQIFMLGGGWNYLMFHTKGCKPSEKVKDLLSLSASVQWGWIKDTSPEEWQINATEMGTRNKLFHIAEQQEAMRAAALVDQDGDGKGEYLLMRELTNSPQVRTDGGYKDRPVNAQRGTLEATLGDVNEQGFSTKDGYRFKTFLASAQGLISDEPKLPGNAANADAQEKPGGFCVYAWPENPGKSGRRIYFTNGKENVWSTLDPLFDVSTGIPEPDGTGLPQSAAWQKEEKGKMFDVKFKFITQAGKPIEGISQDHLLRVSGYQVQFNLLHQDKILRPADYYKAVKLSRSLMRARADGEITEAEAQTLAADFGAVYSIIIVESLCENLAAHIGSQAEKLPAGKAAEFDLLRKELDLLKASLPCDPDKAEDLHERLRIFYSRGW